MQLTAAQRAELERIRCHLPATLAEQVDASELAGRIIAQTVFVVRPGGDSERGGDTWWITATVDSDGVAVIGGHALPAMYYCNGRQVRLDAPSA